LLLARPDHTYAWGPYDLASHEDLKLDYCPCAGLSLELRSKLRPKPITYPLVHIASLKVSEDRWSSGDPVAVDSDATACPAGRSCEGAAFKIRR
jgi:hypothetical protein